MSTVSRSARFESSRSTGERHFFVTPSDSELAGRESITWREAAAAQLCLLTPVMQNRRILDGYFADAGAEAKPVVETDTVSAVYDYVAAIRLSSVIPHTWLHGFGVPQGARPRQDRAAGGYAPSAGRVGGQSPEVIRELPPRSRAGALRGSGGRAARCRRATR